MAHVTFLYLSCDTSHFVMIVCVPQALSGIPCTNWLISFPNGFVHALQYLRFEILCQYFINSLVFLSITEWIDSWVIVIVLVHALVLKAGTGDILMSCPLVQLTISSLRSSLSTLGDDIQISLCLFSFGVDSVIMCLSTHTTAGSSYLSSRLSFAWLNSLLLITSAILHISCWFFWWQVYFC